MTSEMEIIWLGQSGFLFRGKTAKVVVDPFDSKAISLKFPKTEADIVAVTHDHPDHNFLDGVAPAEGKEVFVIKGPGEYEIGGVSVFGVATFHDDKGGAERGKNTVYVFEIDKVKICHLGDLGHRLTDEQVSEIGDIDVLLVPVGGFFTIDAKVGAEVVGQLEPMVVVPMHYKIPGLAEPIAEKLGTVEPFLAEMGAGSIQPVAKLSITKDKLPEQLQVVVLERKTA